MKNVNNVKITFKIALVGLKKRKLVPLFEQVSHMKSELPIAGRMSRYESLSRMNGHIAIKLLR